MQHPESYKVTPNHGPRPAGKPDECFYCGQSVGSEHKPDCVCRLKTVVIKHSFEVVMEVPECWEPNEIEFHYNESSHCSTNVLGEIQKHKENCLCSIHHTDYIREATSEDEEDWDIHILDDANEDVDVHVEEEEGDEE